MARWPVTPERRPGRQSAPGGVWLPPEGGRVKPSFVAAVVTDVQLWIPVIVLVLGASLLLVLR